MSDILEASRAQKLDLQLKTLGPFFRITATSLQTRTELGRAEGLIRISFQGTKILHLDSMKLRTETLSMEKSIFGLGLFIGAVAIRHGYDSGCTTAQLLAINDSDLYHSKELPKDPMASQGMQASFGTEEELLKDPMTSQDTSAVPNTEVKASVQLGFGLGDSELINSHGTSIPPYGSNQWLLQVVQQGQYPKFNGMQ